MMMRSKILWAKIGLVLPIPVGLVCAYQVAFDTWMTAYPFANAHEWRVRLCIRLATTVAVAVIWIFLAVWLFRQRGKKAARTI
jgi:hypothetical protein